MTLFEYPLDSPVGLLRLVATESGQLRALLWPDHPAGLVSFSATPQQVASPPSQVTALLSGVTEQLGEYFKGARTSFDIPLAMEGTEFQLQVWAALQAIPYGETRTYGEQATMIGRPTAVRAVGAANGRNPISIIVPCHRVLGASGSLTGFAGGVATKAQLLALEQHQGSLPFTSP